MAKKKDNSVDPELYTKATKNVAYLRKEIQRLHEEMKAVAADPLASLLGDPRTLGLQIAETTKKLEAAEKERAAMAMEVERQLWREKEAEREKQDNLERAVWAKLISDKADAEAKAIAEAEKQAAEAAKQAEKDAAKQAKANKEEWDNQAALMKAYFLEEQRENAKAAKEEADARKKQASDAAKAIAEELAQVKAANAEKRRAAREFQDTAKELFWTARYGGVSGLATMGASRLIGRMMQGPEQAPTPIAYPAPGTGVVPTVHAAQPGAGAGGAAGGGMSGGATAAVALAGVAGAAMSAAKEIGDFGKQIYATAVNLSQFVAPGVTARHQRAIEDVSAALGTSMLPIVEHATNIFDKINVLFTAAIPRLEPLFDKTGQVVEAFADIFLKTFLMLETQTPILQYMTDALIWVGDRLITLADIVTVVIATFAELSERLRNFDFSAFVNPTGLVNAVQDRLARLPDNRTVAARPAQFTSIEGVGEAARLAAFSARTTAVRQLEETQRQTGILQAIREALSGNNPGGTAGTVVNGISATRSWVSMGGLGPIGQFLFP